MDEARALALLTAVLALQEAERIWGPEDLTAVQAKDRLFAMANAMVVQRDTDIEPGPVLRVMDGGRDGGREGP